MRSGMKYRTFCEQYGRHIAWSPSSLCFLRRVNFLKRAPLRCAPAYSSKEGFFSCLPSTYHSACGAGIGKLQGGQAVGKGRQRLGHITKQGNSLLQGLLTEAAHIASRYDPQWRRKYLRLAMKKNRSIATVAVARCLAVRLWWMWKLGLNYGQMKESRSHAEQLV
jgi:hypothetical protein